MDGYAVSPPPFTRTYGVFQHHQAFTNSTTAPARQNAATKPADRFDPPTMPRRMAQNIDITASAGLRRNACWPASSVI